MNFRLLLLLAAAALASGCEDRGSRAIASGAVEMSGTLVRLKDAGIEFRLPDAWLQGGTAIVDPERIQQDKDGGGEWDAEYAAVLNAAFPIRECVALFGSEPWGAAGSSYADVQMRVYVSRRPMDAVEADLIQKGVEVAKALPHCRGANYLRAATKESLMNPDRRRTRILMALQYGDYGADAEVDCRLKRYGDRIVVFAFAHTTGKDWESDNRALIQKLLDSVQEESARGS